MVVGVTVIVIVVVIAAVAFVNVIVCDGNSNSPKYLHYNGESVDLMQCKQKMKRQMVHIFIFIPLPSIYSFRSHYLHAVLSIFCHVSWLLYSFRSFTFDNVTLVLQQCHRLCAPIGIYLLFQFLNILRRIRQEKKEPKAEKKIENLSKSQIPLIEWQKKIESKRVEETENEAEGGGMMEPKTSQNYCRIWTDALMLSIGIFVVVVAVSREFFVFRLHAKHDFVVAFCWDQTKSKYDVKRVQQ